MRESPAAAGLISLDSRVRGNDENGSVTFYEFVKIALNNYGRHSFAMQTLEGLDKGMVSHLLRHQDPRTIEHYAEYQTAPLKSALDKIRDLKVLERKRPKNAEFE